MIVIDFLLTILVLVVLFGFLVFIHELGHFLAAKLIGVEVEEFAFGFGKKLFAKRYKDTLYRINMIPLGGYVKVLGDEDPSSFKQVEEEDFSDAERQKFEKRIEQIAGGNASILTKIHAIEESEELNEEERSVLIYYLKKSVIPKDPNFILKKSFFGKFFVYSAGVIMNLLTAFVIFTIYLAISNYQARIYNIAKYPFIGSEVVETYKPLVTNVYSDELRQDGFEANEENQGIILLEINDHSILDPEDFERIWDEIENEKVLVDYQLVASGKEFKKELVLNSDEVDLNVDPEIGNKVVIGSVNEDSPASSGGLRATDTILMVNGEDTRYIKAQDFLDFLEANAGQTVTFEVLRENGTQENLQISLNEKDGDNLLLGASFQLNYTPSVAIYELDYSGNEILGGVAHTVNVFGYNPVALFRILSISVEKHDASIAGQSVTSIWGVGESINTLVVGRDYKNIINMAGLVSVSLAFMNILPIPLLDGGQIMFLVIEKLRGKPLGAKMQERVARVSFFLLVGLSILVILKDIWLGFIGDFFRGIF